jgi:alkanesulfonate monooxygenase SsuD/methylene tetrahydromethanopterin reductase-like flavin-dependent oxidoreductase (luciferase family)
MATTGPTHARDGKPFLALAPRLGQRPPATEIAALRTLARAADDAGADLLRLGLEAGAAFPTLEPLSLAAGLIPLTRRIGFCVDIDPRYVEPYTAARGLAALAHLSRGRMAWSLATGPDAPTFVDRMAGDDSPARAAEFVAVVTALWESWGADALIYDQEGALFSDPAGVRPIDWRGRYFDVRGPLNTPRPPSGRPPLFQRRRSGEAVFDQTDFVIASAGPQAALRGAMLLQTDADAWDAQANWTACAFQGFDLTFSLDRSIEALAARIARFKGVATTSGEPS